MDLPDDFPATLQAMRGAALRNNQTRATAEFRDDAGNFLVVFIVLFGNRARRKIEPLLRQFTPQQPSPYLNARNFPLDQDLSGLVTVMVDDEIPLVTGENRFPDGMPVRVWCIKSDLLTPEFKTALAGIELNLDE